MDGQNDTGAAVAGDGAGGADGGVQGHPETGRDRVRRLLLDQLGFRHPRGTDDDAARRFLDRLADELGYMADDRLAVLRDMMRTHGQGSARNQWPDHASFIGWAEVVQPRPLEDLPALLRWFGSVEGPRAIAEGTLVETWEYIRMRKVPPVTQQARQLVAERAAESNRRIAILAERRAAGMSVNPADDEWGRWYLARRAACEEIVARERAARAAGDAA